MTARLTDEQRLDWLRLIRSENVGPRTFRALVNQFGGASAALEALPDLARRGGRLLLKVATRAEAERRSRPPPASARASSPWASPTTPGPCRPSTPRRPLIAVRGCAVLARPCVAIVGSRNASAAGLTFTERLARGWGRRATWWSRASRAASTPAPTRRRSPPARSPCSRAGRTGSIPPRTSRCSAIVERAARCSPRCPWAGSRGARLPPPQPHRVGPVLRRRRGGGGAPLGLAHHGALRPGAGAGGLRRAGLAPRPPGRGHQRPHPRGRDALRRGRARDGGAGGPRPWDPA
jgi:hypothetical protein